MCTNFEHVASLWFITGAPLLKKNWPLKLPLSIEILCNVNPTHHATVAPFKSTHCSGFGWFEPLCIWPKVFASLKNSWKVVKNQIRCVLKKLWNDIFFTRNKSVSTAWDTVQFFRCFFPFSTNLVLFRGPCFSTIMLISPIWMFGVEIGRWRRLISGLK